VGFGHFNEAKRIKNCVVNGKKWKKPVLGFGNSRPKGRGKTVFNNFSEKFIQTLEKCYGSVGARVLNREALIFINSYDTCYPPLSRGYRPDENVVEHA
jgi:hypothetical protein